MITTYIENCANRAWQRGATGESFWQALTDEIDITASDRRYRLHINARSCGYRPSAIVTYRGVRMDLYHDYPTDRVLVTRIY